MYVALAKPTVLLSSLRPLTRRAFTCGHELDTTFSDTDQRSTNSERTSKAQRFSQTNSLLTPSRASF